MSVFFLLAAVVLFVIDALTPVFEWDLGEFRALSWGLASFATSFLVGSAAFAAWRNRA